MTISSSRRLGALLALAVTTLAGLAGTPAGAQAASDAELTPVFEHRRAGAVNTQGTIGQPMSSPAFGDVSGDGVADLVVGSLDGTLSVLDPRDGTVLRSIVVQPGSMVQTAPTLVDVTGDGVLDVVVGTVRNVPDVPGSSRVKIYDLSGPEPRVVFDQGDSGQANLSGFFGAVVVGDIDGDAVDEVVALGLDHRLHAWELSGAVVPGFPTYTYDTSLSSPALADVDRDGAKEIVFGGDMDAINQPLEPGGYLWAVDGKGDPLPGYPLRLGGEVIWSSPAVADVDGDGDLDAVVGTGRNFGAFDQRTLHAIDLAARRPLSGWPRSLSGNTMGSPALADLDGDAGLEAVTLTGEGRAHMVDDTGRRVWQVCVMPEDVGCNGDLSYIASPVLADVDSDDRVEAVVAGNREVLVLDAGTGEIEQRLALSSDPDAFAWPAANAPAVGVIDGTVHVAAYVQIDNGDRQWDHGDEQGIYVWSAAAEDEVALPWAHFRRHPARTGTIDPNAPAPRPTPPSDDPYRDYNAYVDAVYRDLLGRRSTLSERVRWGTELRRGMPRGEFTLTLARSKEWTGSVVDGLYQEIFGRAPDPAGRGYWSGLIADGTRVAEIAAHLYGSDEWFEAPPPTGGASSVNGYVDSLYRRILRREVDPSSHVYWAQQIRHGTSRVTVAKALYLSYEANVRRVDVLYRQLLDRRPDIEGRDYWGRQLIEVDDVRLAALLTASDEYLAANGR